MTETSPIVEGLVTIHKVITRGLTTALKKCDEYQGKKGIPPGEAAGFSMFVSALKMVTHSHHLSEDDIVFPLFREHIEAPFDRLKDDHEKISRIIADMDKLLSEKSADGVGELHKVLDEFEKLWFPHISIEEKNFTAEKLQAAMGVKEQESIIEKLGEHGRKNSGPAPVVLPFVMYNLEGRDRVLFTKSFPWILKKVLVPIVWRKQWKPMSPFFF